MGEGAGVYVAMEGWCSMVGGGRVDKWEIVTKGMDGWGGGESKKAVREKGELDESMVVDGR